MTDNIKQMRLTAEEVAIIERHRQEIFADKQEKLLRHAIRVLVGEYSRYLKETGMCLSYSEFCGNFNAEQYIPDELQANLSAIYRYVCESWDAISAVLDGSRCERIYDMNKPGNDNE